MTTSESATIRFYRVPTHSRIAPDLEYACWRLGGGHPLLLGYAGWLNGLVAAHITLVTLAPQTGAQPSSVIAWLQRTEGRHPVNTLSLMSGNVRTGRLIHRTAPLGMGDVPAWMVRGYFIVTPTGSLGWFGPGGPVDAKGENSGPEGIWTFDAHGEQLLRTGEWTARPLTWSAGTLYWTLEGPTTQATPLE